MPPAWHLTPGVDLQEIVPYLSPGSVVGVYDDGGWVDWETEASAPVVLISGYDLRQRPSGDPARFHFIIHNSTSRLSLAELGGALSVLVRKSRGVALVTSRVGVMLRLAHRVLTAQRDRPPRLSPSSGAHPSRSSGAWIASLANQWKLLETSELSRRAMLSLEVENSAGASRVLEQGFRSVRVKGNCIRLPLTGTTPEEVLERLHGRSIRVRCSAVWFPPLQSCPFEHELMDVEQLPRPG